MKINLCAMGRPGLIGQYFLDMQIADSNLAITDIDGPGYAHGAGSLSDL